MYLVQILHRKGFAHGSLFERNVVVEPGPICLPPEERSLASPSFRLVDFGRGCAKAELRRIASVELNRRLRKGFKHERDYDKECLRSMLKRWALKLLDEDGNVQT